MKSYLLPEDVYEELGDKVVEGFSAAVGAMAEDLSEYRMLAVGPAPTTAIPAVDKPTAPEIEVKSDAEAEDDVEDNGSA
jgi:hypothetical protein